MVVPPTFSDLGKVAKDVFNKGFSIGSNKLTVKTKTSAGISLSPVFEMKNDGLVASFETSGSPAEGFTLKEKWTSENVTKTNLVVEDKIAKGLKLDLEVVVNAASGKKGAVAKTAYKTDGFNGTFDANLDLAGPTLNATAVGEYSGVQGGAEVAFDTEKSKLTKNTLAVGYSQNDFTFVGFVKDLSVFEGLVHHKVNADTEIAASLNWNNQTNGCSFNFGTKHVLDKATALRMKIDNNGKTTLSITHKVKPWLEATFSNQVNAKTLNGLSHGISLEASL